VSLTSTVISAAERLPLPDIFIRTAIHRLCSRTAARLSAGDAGSDAAFARGMAARAIAEHTDAANAQHYEVPAAFFERVLGPNRKYSSCFYSGPTSSLREAEEEALRTPISRTDKRSSNSAAAGVR
jgi:cyclopropane-fatty-acyl-phospholipid synthase